MRSRPACHRGAGGGAVAHDHGHRVPAGGGRTGGRGVRLPDTGVCPAGYSRHTYQDRPTQCLYVSPRPPFDTDLRDATTSASFARPRLAWAGIGAAGLGAVLLTLPDNRVTRDLHVQVSPERVAVRRKFGW